jgi:hypothetical protein
MTDDSQKGILLGFAIGTALIISIGLYYTIRQPVAKSVAEPTPSKGTFKVIDHYKDCDLVQYQYNMLADYKYLLHCPK